MTNPLHESRSLRAVVFDWAGTMIDYGSRAPAAVFVEIFRRRGVEISVEQAREPMGKAKREHIAAILAMEDVASRWKEKLGSYPGEQDIDELYETFLPLQLETLGNHCDLIPGAKTTAAECRKRGLKIAGTTGYTSALMECVLPLAAAAGYAPDVSLSADDAPAGRPAPWLLFEVAKRLNVYPMWSVVKVDDTTVGIQAGRNAGTWTVGVTRSGNQLGLSEKEVDALSEAELTSRLNAAEKSFVESGAHFVVESVAGLPEVLDEIQVRLTRGESP